MGKKSKGYKRRTRKLRKHIRERGLLPISKAIQELDAGLRVAIVVDPSVPKGQPHRRYHGKVGIVTEKRGRAYVVEVSDGDSIKRIISRPEHLKVVGA